MKILEGVIPYPLDCELRLGSVFASLLTYLQKDIPDEMLPCNNPGRTTGKPGDPCTDCGKCRMEKHGKCRMANSRKRAVYADFANEYAFVSGQSLLQFDLPTGHFLSKIGMPLPDVFDDTVDFMLRYAGYRYSDADLADRARAHRQISASIDRGVPVLMQYRRNSLWLLVTGYGGNLELYGYDGARMAPHEKMDPPPDSYQKELFCASNWHENAKRVVILGEKCEPTATLADAIARNERIMRPIFEQNYYQAAADYIRDDKNFKGRVKLRRQAERISGFIGVPINARSVTAWFSETLMNSGDAKTRECFGALAHLCSEMHDICWVAWHAVGTYKRKPRRYIRLLADPVYRDMLAAVVERVGSKDREIYECLVNFLDEREAA